MLVRTEVKMDVTGSINSFSAGTLLFDCSVCTNKIQRKRERETAEIGEAREREREVGDGDDGLEIQQEKPGE